MQCWWPSLPARNDASPVGCDHVLKRSQTRYSLLRHLHMWRCRKTLEALKDDPELSAVFEDIKNSGAAAMERYWNDTDLMTKISQKMAALGVGAQQSKPAKHIPVRLPCPQLQRDVHFHVIAVDDILRRQHRECHGGQLHVQQYNMLSNM